MFPGVMHATSKGRQSVTWEIGSINSQSLIPLIVHGGGGGGNLTIIMLPIK